MLSLGIRFGRGFDRDTIRKFIESGRRACEYDVLILGTNAGGLVCAREAARYGKKTALVYWKISTPGEEEGFDEDLNKIANALNLDEASTKNYVKKVLEEESKSEVESAVIIPRLRKSKISHFEQGPENDYFFLRTWHRKVRRSKADLKNSITNMADEGLKYMHEIAVKRDSHSDKTHGKKLLKLSWGKMMEMVRDYIIKRNWTILTDNIQDKISIFNGYPLIIDDHKVKIIFSSGEERDVTADTIISAMEVRNSFPVSVAGARQFGVTFDDFFRLSGSPGKTLVVGAGALGMECAGILSSFDFPVTVVYRTEIMKECDREIVSMISDDLIHRGVTFLGKTTLLAIDINDIGDRLIATFYREDDDTSDESQLKKTFNEEFDTVLFTTKEKMDSEPQEKTALQMESEKLTGKMYSSEEETFIRSFLRIDDIPGNKMATQMSGEYMAKAIFEPQVSSEISISVNSTCKSPSPRNSRVDLIPNVVLTPTEYAYVGTSLESAITRIGKSCIDVFTGYIETAEIFPEEVPPTEKICFVKGIIYKKKGIILGLHFLGNDAFRIISNVLVGLKEKCVVSNLPDAIRNLFLSYEEEDGEIIEE